MSGIYTLLTELSIRCREVAADLHKQPSGYCSDSPYFQVGFYSAGCRNAASALESAARVYTPERVANELRDQLLDELWADGEFAEEWGPVANEECIHTWLRTEWMKALTRNLPEVLAYHLWDYLTDVLDLKALAHLLAGRVYEACCDEVEFDPTPDPPQPVTPDDLREVA